MYCALHSCGHSKAWLKQLFATTTHLTLSSERNVITKRESNPQNSLQHQHFQQHYSRCSMKSAKSSLPNPCIFREYMKCILTLASSNLCLKKLLQNICFTSVSTKPGLRHVIFTRSEIAIDAKRGLINCSLNHGS